MKLEGFELIFPREYLRAALMVSLLSVWVLVGLFYYLNRFTRRQYFTVWTAAWLFYALWLTLSVNAPGGSIGSIIFLIKQWCVAISAVFLLWGSAAFLNLPIRQKSFGFFMAFLVVWIFVSPQVINSELQIQLPVFILLGLGSVFAGVCFYRVRKRRPFVGAGMLSLGFLLWGLYLTTYPFSQKYDDLYSAGFFAAAVLQLFIAVSMIVLVLEEVRFKTEEMREEMAAVLSEKEALQVKVLTTEEQCRSLYDQVRLTAGVQKAYEELRHTQQAVVQQERLRALGQMASGVAHDVNNALSPIIAYSDLMLSTMPDLPENARHFLETINRSGDDIAHIVSRMREFYRKRSDTEQLTKVNLNQIIEEVVELTRPRWRDVSQRQGVFIQIEQKLEPKLPLLCSEPTDLREALINLVFNAVDAMSHGGKITLVSRCVDRPVTEQNDCVERQVQIEVHDEGIGMDEKTRQRCLEPFFSTKAHRGGSGLGLAMVYGMMQRHEGAIEIISTPGSGTCVRLIFPIREKIVRPVPDLSSSENQERPLNILCIDDEPQVRQLLTDCLGHFKHEVSLASSGKQGLELFRNALHSQKPYSAVITDLGMPDLDGHQVARRIKAESPDTPVVMMTGWGTMMKEDGETTPQVDALIGKPPRMHELQNLLLKLTATKVAAGSVRIE
jgi:signal transduction histidine kinase/ActR/RegA family two-component response regulator